MRDDLEEVEDDLEVVLVVIEEVLRAVLEGLEYLQVALAVLVCLHHVLGKLLCEEKRHNRTAEALSLIHI